MQEKELKYRIIDEIEEVERKIKTSSGFKKYQFGPLIIQDITDVYYDTKDFKLLKSPGYLRIRNINGERIIALKKGFSENPEDIDEIRHSLNDKGIEQMLKYLSLWFHFPSNADLSYPSFDGVLDSIGLKPCLNIKMKRIQRNVYLPDLHDEICKIRFDEFFFPNISDKKFHEIEIINFRRVFDESVTMFKSAFTVFLDTSFIHSEQSKSIFGMQLTKKK